MKRIKIFIIAIFTLCFTTGCFFKRDNMENINIYTTIYPLNYLTTYLYGEYAKVHSIYPTGVTVSEFNLSEKKLNDYAKSDLFIYNGLDKDRDYAVKMVNLNENLKIIDTSISVTYDYSVNELWLNPNNYLMMAQNIKDGLNEYITNPYILTEINTKYEELNKSLSKLDANLKESLKYSTYKTLVVDTDALKYLENLLTDKSITIISLDNTEEVNITYTVKKDDTLDKIAKKYNVTIDSIIKQNNLTDNKIYEGLTLEITMKTISTNNLNKVKKLIQDKEIKYIYSLTTTTNDTVKDLIDEYNLELVTLNDMNTVDGGVTNSNENYLTIMNNNIDLLKKELYK